MACPYSDAFRTLKNMCIPQSFVKFNGMNPEMGQLLL